MTAGHLDLLPISRQLWKHRLGNARLATVEAEVCGVRRNEDLPGALIPDQFFSYLRSRRANLLRDVVDHNRQDIVSLGLLVAELSTASWIVSSRVICSGWPVLTRADVSTPMRCASSSMRSAQRPGQFSVRQLPRCIVSSRQSGRGFWRGSDDARRRSRPGWISRAAADPAPPLPGCTSRATESTSSATWRAPSKRATKRPRSPAAPGRGGSPCTRSSATSSGGCRAYRAKSSPGATSAASGLPLELASESGTDRVVWVSRPEMCSSPPGSPLPMPPPARAIRRRRASARPATWPRTCHPRLSDRSPCAAAAVA